MKAKIISFFLLTGVFLSVQAQLKPLFTAHYFLNDMYCLNADTVFVCGNGGKVLSTFNGGTSWQTDSLPTKFNFMSVTMKKSGLGYLAGDSGTLFKTTDFGANWSRITTNINDNINNLNFYNDSCGYAFNKYGSYGNIIYKTQNGGKIWSKLFDGYSSDKYIRNYYVIDKDTIFRNSTTGLYVTYNAGILWDTLNSYDYNSMAWQNSKIGFVAGYKYLFKTIDGGVTFNLISTVYHPIKSITIINDSTLIVSGNDFGGIGTSKTTDGGKTWLNYPELLACFTNFLNKDTGFLVDSYNIYKTIYKTSNGCISPPSGGLCTNIIGAINNSAVTDIIIAPNPLENFAIISLPSTYTNAHYKLYNNLGQLVEEKTLTSLSYQIYKGNKPSGIYFLNITDNKNNFIETHKLVIK